MSPQIDIPQATGRMSGSGRACRTKPLPAAVVAAQGQGILPRRDKTRLRARPKGRMGKNRFDGKDSENLNADEIAFGAAMQTYLGGRADWTCREVLGVLISLGYVNSQRNFEINVQKLTTAITDLKRKTHRMFPSFSEVLKVAVRQGWHRRGQR
jgi:hypothetical protein